MRRNRTARPLEPAKPSPPKRRFPTTHERMDSVAAASVQMKLGLIEMGLLAIVATRVTVSTKDAMTILRAMCGPKCEKVDPGAFDIAALTLESLGLIEKGNHKLKYVPYPKDVMSFEEWYAPREEAHPHTQITPESVDQPAPATD